MRIKPYARYSIRLRVHKTIEPTIPYFGTPVALLSTLNPDGSPNLAPMSSAWWLGWSCMLGLGQMGQTSDNLIRTRECVINLPSEDLVKRVDRLALTTGKNPVPERKRQWGYRYESDKLFVSLPGFASTAHPRRRLVPRTFRVLREAVRISSVLNVCSSFVRGCVQILANLDRPEQKSTKSPNFTGGLQAVLPGTGAC